MWAAPFGAAHIDVWSWIYDASMTYQGQQQQQRPKRRLWPIFLIIGSVLAGCGICGFAGFSALFTAGSNTRPSGTTYAIGQRAADGKLTFTVSGVDCSSTTIGKAPLSRTAMGTFCVVTLNVENTGRESATFIDSLQKGYDASGREYSTDSAATAYAAPNVWLATINPGGSVQNGMIVFDVAAGTSLASLVLHDGPFSGGVRVHV
jgi:hypothetical protein